MKVSDSYSLELYCSKAHNAMAMVKEKLAIDQPLNALASNFQASLLMTLFYKLPAFVNLFFIKNFGQAYMLTGKVLC